METESRKYVVLNKGSVNELSFKDFSKLPYEN